MAGLCVLTTGIILVVQRLVGQGSDPTEGAGEAANRAGWIRVGAVLASLAGWTVLVKVLGYVLVSCAMALGIAKLFAYKGWVRPFIFSAFIALFVWFIFGFLFFVDLPAIGFV